MRLFLLLSCLLLSIATNVHVTAIQRDGNLAPTNPPKVEQPTNNNNNKAADAVKEAAQQLNIPVNLALELPVGEQVKAAAAAAAAKAAAQPAAQPAVAEQNRAFTSGKPKITVVSNANFLHQHEAPNLKINNQQLEEQARKSHKEENEKKISEERMKFRSEEMKKKERVSMGATQRLREEVNKREAVDAFNQKLEEEDTKYQEVKKNEKKQEAEQKKQIEQEFKKQAEQTEKQAGEQKQKQVEAEKQAQEEAKKQIDQKKTIVDLAQGWTNYGATYAEAEAHVIDGICYVSGLLRGTAQGGVVATLPDGCRPSQGRLIFSLLRGDLPARVDVLPDGRIYHIVGGGGDWLSLAGIRFAVNINAPVELMNGWVNYASGYRTSAQVRVGEICMITGLVKNGDWGRPVGRTIQECFPKEGKLIFSLNNHATITRVDLDTNGYLYRVGGSNSHGWLNLDGMIWSADGGNPLPLLNGWQNYNHGWRNPVWKKIGRVCVVSGLMRSSTWQHHVAVLPAECRPKQRLIFGTNVHESSARVDVLADGQIHYIRGQLQWDWLALDGIAFVV